MVFSKNWKVEKEKEIKEKKEKINQMREERIFAD